MAREGHGGRVACHLPQPSSLLSATHEAKSTFREGAPISSATCLRAVSQMQFTVNSLQFIVTIKNAPTVNCRLSTIDFLRRHHRFQHFRQNGRRRVVVEVDHGGSR
jgi:hypothetical protein